MKQSIRVKVLKSFRNPLTDRMAKVDQCMNVPESIFWLKRLSTGDCEKSKKVKVQFESLGSKVVKNSKKGSK